MNICSACCIAFQSILIIYSFALKSFLQGHCGREGYLEPGFRWCNDSVSGFYCKKTTNETRECFKWRIGEGSVCSDSEECCGDEFKCINEICKSANGYVDFVIIAKVALASALILTVLSIFTLCWKGFIEPRCMNQSSHLSGDNTSLSSSERFVRSQCYEIRAEKPPPYEECVQESSSGWSSLEPPPYSIAVSIGQSSTNLSCSPSSCYYMTPSSSLFQLNVQEIKLQGTLLTNITEVSISSPVSSMDDFVYYSTTESVRDTGSTTHTNLHRPSEVDDEWGRTNT